MPCTTSSASCTASCGPTSNSSPKAARWLCDLAIADGYAGLEHKHLAFGLALILDELARHLRDLDEELRALVLGCCRQVLGQQ
jgi:hypothetical protein